MFTVDIYSWVFNAWLLGNSWLPFGIQLFASGRAEYYDTPCFNLAWVNEFCPKMILFGN
jgi:hypothetical protein